MKDSASEGWYGSGDVSMKDINGNTIFKSFMRRGKPKK